jgi:methionyl-tRNA formyltransferase
MRLVMMGTGPFAVPTFSALLDSEHEVAALVTRPLPPSRGRQQTPPTPMRDVALTRGVLVLEPADINAAESHPPLARLAAELFVVCDYGQILSAATLALARLGGINLHASLLPEYRGAAPINWALWDGRTETGVTVIHMTPRLDGGPLLVQRKTAIEPHETAVALEQRLSLLGVEAVLSAIDMLSNWDGHSALGVSQDPARATRAPRLKKTDGAVDWSQSAERICNQVRALKPWPGTYTHCRTTANKPMRLILDAVSRPDESEVALAPPGTIVVCDKHRLLVATGTGLLSIDRVQPEGKRPMDISEFLRGHDISVGQRLSDLP